MVKQEIHIVKGMQRDTSVSKFNPEFVYDARNIRITSRENTTQLSVTNEKGNTRISVLDMSTRGEVKILGTIIGYNVLNKYITLFTTSFDIASSKTADRIYRLCRVGSAGTAFEGILLYEGDLGFSDTCPVETLGVYENDDVQKVYWIDGRNQARVINITAPDDVRSGWCDTSFDFVRELRLGESVTVTRDTNTSGMFAPGVIQYAFTYYDLYGQESNIFYTSPLQYISYDGRGASPEDKVGCSFIIKVSNLDTRFDFLRIYSIHRTSIDATPTVVNVADLPVSFSGVTYIDTGTTGSTVDPSEMMYIGGESIIPKAMAAKDNTLFLGNIRLDNKVVSSDLVSWFKSRAVRFTTRDIPVDYVPLKGYYPYKSQLGHSDIRRFKYLEWYRFGIQFQNRTGKWSEAVYIGDFRNTVSSDSQTRAVSAEFTIPSDIVKRAVSQGFVRARGLVVYPSYTDREVIAQGILCPTVYNLEDRYSNSPYAQSSWFIRPNMPVDEGHVTSSYYRLWRDYKYKVPGRDGEWVDIVSLGSWAEFRHNYPIPDNWNRNAEIQCLADVPDNPLVTSSDTNDITPWVARNKEYFFVDQSVLTFHSPDIEMDDVLHNLDMSNVRMRIVGAVGYTANASDLDIQTSTPQNDVDRPGFYTESMGVENVDACGVKSLISGVNYIDGYYKHNEDMPVSMGGFMVYPWHRNGSLNNQPTLDEDETSRTAMLKYNRRSNLKFSGYTRYMSVGNVWEAYVSGSSNRTGISGVAVFNSDVKSLVRIPSPKNSGVGDINYYGNVDRVIVPTRNDTEYECDTPFTGFYHGVFKSFKLNKRNGYPIVGTMDGQLREDAYHSYFSNPTVPIWDLVDYQNDHVVEDERYAYGTDPVSIKYKSSPHAVLALNYTKDHRQNVLPTIAGSHIVNGVSNIYKNKYLPWDTSCVGVNQDWIPSSALGDVASYGFSWLAELYREVDDSVRFGGKTQGAIEANLWLPGGEPVSLVSGYDSKDNPVAKTGSVTVTYTEGDTYFQRYDCLKTYPFTLEDQNSVTEIASFMCETRVNIDGRYDRNRGQIDNTMMTPTNFNLINKVYSQSNNFFTYRTLDYDRMSNDYFPNTVTWTKEKHSGESVDTWTNMTMASTLDIDGTHGGITSLVAAYNNIYFLQKSGVGVILFNSRVQIPVSDGVPVEISNGMKVDGYRYLNDTVGCQNKWSVCIGNAGVYFIDNITRHIFRLNGEGISSLSDSLGMSQWIGRFDITDEWNPVTFKNFVTHFDNTNRDVYFTNDGTSLVFSEKMGAFTSFMDYGGVPYMFNVENKFYSLYKNELWRQFDGDYNMFFGQFRPYSLTYVSNADEPYDKIFNNIEFRADCWKTDRYGNDTLDNRLTFDTLEVWNEYQKGVTDLRDVPGRPSPLKRKFRVWRADIPRANTDWNGVKANGRDRIRNTWAYIKLSMNTQNTDRMELHDMIVKYFV